MAFCCKQTRCGCTTFPIWIKQKTTPTKHTEIHHIIHNGQNLQASPGHVEKQTSLLPLEGLLTCRNQRAECDHIRWHGHILCIGPKVQRKVKIVFETCQGGWRDLIDMCVLMWRTLFLFCSKCCVAQKNPLASKNMMEWDVGSPRSFLCLSTYSQLKPRPLWIFSSREKKNVRFSLHPTCK